MKNEQLHQLLYEALETEMGGVQVYKTAIRCAVNEELKEEWEEYLEQTEKHEQIVRDLLGKFKLDPDKETPGRKIVRHIGESLVKAMEMALESGKPEAAQIVAAECVVEAETKDHLNWELIAQVAEKTKGEDAKKPKGSTRTGGRGRRRAPVSHYRMGPGIMDRVARVARCDTPSRRGKGR